MLKFYAEKKCHMKNTKAVIDTLIHSKIYFRAWIPRNISLKTTIGIDKSEANENFSLFKAKTSKLCLHLMILYKFPQNTVTRIWSKKLQERQKMHSWILVKDVGAWCFFHLSKNWLSLVFSAVILLPVSPLLSHQNSISKL